MENVERMTSWSGDSHSEPQGAGVRSRSLSLPAPGLGQDSRYMRTLPALSDVQRSRGGWEKLGLYMTGLPPKHSKEKAR